MKAIYVRQSVDRKDSISIETQIETCKSKIGLTNTEKIEIFSDKGFSGKSTDRPEFQRMMKEVRNGNISQIIVYKLDRISRSLLDFITMRSEFTKYNVDFISCAEDFDTSTTMGKLILNILMMFAEMERETIQKRATDNFYARGEMGFYLSGQAPFGYKKVEIYVNNKKTYTLEEVPEESIILKQMFQDYLSGKSMLSIARWLNDNKIPNRKNKPWGNSNVSRMLKSPTYVKANVDVYNYLLGLGATMNNSIEDFKGEKGCLVYGKPADRKGMKFSNLSTDYVTLGFHEGIIDASLWMSVQSIINSKQKHSNLGTGNLSWLQGLIKCKCGYTYYVKKCINRKHKNPIEYRYFYCKGKLYNTCEYSSKMISSYVLEDIIKNKIVERLNDLKNTQAQKREEDSPELNSLKIQVTKIDEQIEKIINQLLESSEVTAKYLNQTIEKLDNEKKVYIDRINEIQLKRNRVFEINIDIDYILDNWENFSYEDKKSTAKDIIEKVMLDGDEINVIFY